MDSCEWKKLGFSMVSLIIGLTLGTLVTRDRFIANETDLKEQVAKLEAHISKLEKEGPWMVTYKGNHCEYRRSKP